MPPKRVSKNIILAIIIITIAILVLLVWYAASRVKKTEEKKEQPLTKEQILKSLTAPSILPSGAQISIPDKKVLQTISAPKRLTPTKVDSKIINSLTAPTKSQ